MRYLSTRGGTRPVGLGVALSAGLASDGGLYVPEALPLFRADAFSGREPLSTLAAGMLAPFINGDALLAHLPILCAEALDIPAPLRALAPRAWMLELFHGPTAAFKDFGARFLASCLSRLPSDDGRERVILAATSGDTGAAVAAAFHKKPGTRVILLYPKGRVSQRQAHGLECWGGNVRTLRVAGTFDDCQRIVKQALSDPDPRGELSLLSANSINLGRWLPQAAYYAYAALRALRTGKAPLRLIVPTGNLGNAMAALLLRKAGWPIADVALACNVNDVLPHYFSAGIYEPQLARATVANAMDVGAPSNFERLSWLDPHADADPIRWRTGSTSSSGPNMPLLSGTVSARVSSASRTFCWLTGSQFGISKVPGPPGWLTVIASCSRWTSATSAGPLVRTGSSWPAPSLRQSPSSSAPPSTGCGS